LDCIAPGSGWAAIESGRLPPVVDTRHEYGRLADLYLVIGGVVFALVVAVFFLFLWRYRAGRRDTVDERAQHMPAEATWIAVVAVVVVVLLVATYQVEDRVDAVASNPALAVHVTAAKWDWTFRYADGRRLRGQLVVPAGRTIRFDAVSLDVLHDFWVPGVRFQRQVWPDHVERFDLVFAHPGRYQGLCAWFCGLYHQNMRFTVRALDPGAFARWQRQGTA
jgi:cytochrome c oxidase subunit 2